MSLWPSRRGGPAGGSGSVVLRAPVATGCIRPPRPGPVWLLLADKLRATSAAWPSAARQRAVRASRCRASARRDGPHPIPRVPRCPARPCATSSWATSECPTSPSSAPAAAARIWLLLADKPHAASAAWLHQIGCPSRPACLPRLPRPSLPRERPPRRHASGPRASRDGPHPPPGATPASLPPLPGAPRRGAARRRSSPRLGRSSAPRWWGSP